MNSEVRVRIELGRSRIGVHDLGHLSPGDVIALDCPADDDVELLAVTTAAPRLLARGQVVCVGGRLGVRVAEVMSS
jgi:flagellar motor switch/type III secretory pathway protein FliN